MDIQFSISDEAAEYLQQIIRLEASMQGFLTEEEVSNLLLEMLRRGMDSVHNEQRNILSERLEEDPDKVFEDLEVGPNGIVWLTYFGSVMEIPVC